MYRPSKTFTRVGFYLVLLFSFCVSVFPSLAYFLAAMIFCLWLLELMIFKNTDWIKLPMFYPIAGFAAFCFLAWFVSWSRSGETIVPYLGLLSFFYIVIQRFVPFQEKRKMIIWTFMAGVILSSGIDLILRLVGEQHTGVAIHPATGELSFLMVIVFCFILAFYVEGKYFREKLFFGLVSIPIATVAVLSFNMIVLFILLFIILCVGILKDRTILIPLSALAIIVFLDLFGTKGGFEKLLPQQENKEFAFSAINEIKKNHTVIAGTRFFGLETELTDDRRGQTRPKTYFIHLITSVGPPSLILFIWIMAEQARRDLAKFRKVSSRETRAYHMGALLTIVAMLIMNIYGSTFDSGSSILAFWMILGMSEI